MPRDFVVSEEELRNLMVTYYAGTFREAVDNFLKSKQPVEIYDKHTYLYQCAKEIRYVYQ
jgi:hypothetical protein